MKLHLFGASGSGVTTLGTALADVLGYPYFDSDTYYWEPTNPPFTVRRRPSERDQLIRDHLAGHEDWILGGSVINWGDHWLHAFDLAVFLWVPPAIRLERLKQREWSRSGDVIFTDSVRNNQYNEFISWASGYDDDTARGRTLTAHQTWMQTLSCPCIDIRGDTSVEQRANRILLEINRLTS
ncbi:adenylate kinase [Fibrisoma montanum]|uniref:Adenylate kinase n=1 Tax=Fibrisoma montanum TaxID=2305895 RepID=A0A418M2I2_9BACT|nr:adenylate kinase [Fibrisoma montanum]RIV19790.1 adenylate kinase [Fibrisoma montanum]